MTLKIDVITILTAPQSATPYQGAALSEFLPMAAILAPNKISPARILQVRKSVHGFVSLVCHDVISMNG